MYYSSTDKKDIPYFYEIIEKIDGISLYNVWHTFNETQREEIIKHYVLLWNAFIVILVKIIIGQKEYRINFYHYMKNQNNLIYLVRRTKTSWLYIYKVWELFKI